MTVHDFLLGTRGLDAADLGAMGLHFLMLSLLSIGGAMSTAAEMHRYLVVERGWLGEVDFTTAIALAQAAPGPNDADPLFVDFYRLVEKRKAGKI